MKTYQRLICAFASVISLTFAHPSRAADGRTYTYDARGRLIKVESSGGPNDGVVSNYVYDKADNRTRVIVDGSPQSGSGPSEGGHSGDTLDLVVVPIAGYSLIFIK
ncbi:hypothetical protein BA950_07710 [Erythrobacter sp. SAORIC-644]|uniref:RHS repeat protein n=1 Tax=Erythrobacter sp. SAORIC-644 TaxID=1869314 RepID=UPI000C9FF5C7|nr:RHS repeat protein [Erythrobacter sp. SAORIC-644]PNQ76354.1 hypothetical protein BA950_07710 [Erythrobacter sp. SAORIC-644]